MRIISQLIIHCAYTKPSMDIGADEIRAWHLDRGWSDIGYHYVIRRDGTLENGRDLDKDGDVDEEVGAHALGFNANSIGICLIGGMREEGGSECNYTSVQWKALEDLIRLKRHEYPNVEVLGHNDLTTAKTCPVFNVKQWVSTLY